MDADTAVAIVWGNLRETITEDDAIRLRQRLRERGDRFPAAVLHKRMDSAITTASAAGQRNVSLMEPKDVRATPHELRDELDRCVEAEIDVRGETKGLRAVREMLSKPPWGPETTNADT